MQLSFFQYVVGKNEGCGSLVDALRVMKVSYALDIPQNKSM